MLAPSPYVPRRPPRAKQAEALELINGREVFALFMAMRTGKTKVILDHWGRLVTEGKAQDLLVIAPGGVYRTWEGEIEKELSDDLFKQTLTYVWTSGANSAGAKKRLELFLKFQGPRICMINVEALSVVEAARNLCVNFLAQRSSMLAIDESTSAKNPAAKRTKFIVQKLAPKADYRYILSGLPTPRSPLDLYSQFEFLDPKILDFGSYWAFRARYAIIKKVQFDRSGRRPAVNIVTGYRNVEELQQKISPHSFRVKLSDCYDQPPSNYSFRDVMMTAEQARVYNELKAFATAELDNGAHVTATQVIVQMLRLHQLLCGFTRDEHGGWHEIKENRTSGLIELLNEYDGKAIIWCSYDLSVRRVSEALIKEFGEGSVARFWGGNRKTREEEEYRFKNDPVCRFECGTPDAGGKGRTWDVADLTVFYSSTNDLEKRDQGEARGLNDGKIKPMSFVDMRVPNTVEEKIIYGLREKIDLTTTITSENYRQWLI